MDQGRIIARGTPRSLVDSLGEVQFVDFETTQPPDEGALLALPAVNTIDRRGARYRLCVGRTLAALTSVLEELERQQVTPVGLSTHQASLDDVFLHLTGRGLTQEAAEAGGESP
jgi:ABC-2 type transport system ATP-binding protein